ncbi:MAG TPA: B12-binding domain-containing radical SAM protein, partial [Nitrospiraceae bacterium]|nr:B12-binding domain-containing radical SAM protein [Nitrospiraceae bacterium]
RIYTSKERPGIEVTPIPDWSLINMNHYSSMSLQYSRGCPFDCEFCNITSLFGRIPRTIRPDQIISELEKILSLGWKGGVFFVDDNFIGNRTELKTEILPRIIAWMTMNNHPFFFLPEASINLADDAELIKMMVAAGFITVFVGIETTHEESLHECTNIPNRNRDLITSVRKIKSFGLEVQAGFIVGFDKDPATIFERMIEFIRESRIATAMVGLLKAPRGTKLYDCLITENRLMNAVSGDNTDFSINFIPKMNYESLMTGYKKIIDSIYSPRNYYARVLQFLKEYHPEQKKMFHMQWGYVKATVKSVVVLGLLNKERFHYWRLFFWSLFGRPRLFPLAITFSIYGFHFRRIFEQHFRTIENKGSTFSSS